MRRGSYSVILPVTQLRSDAPTPRLQNLCRSSRARACWNSGRSIGDPEIRMQSSSVRANEMNFEFSFGTRKGRKGFRMEPPGAGRKRWWLGWRISGANNNPHELIPRFTIHFRSGSFGRNRFARCANRQLRRRWLVTQETVLFTTRRTTHVRRPEARTKNYATLRELLSLTIHNDCERL